MSQCADRALPAPASPTPRSKQVFYGAGDVPHQALDCSAALYKRIWVKALVMLLGQNEGGGAKGHLNTFLKTALLVCDGFPISTLLCYISWLSGY